MQKVFSKNVVSFLISIFTVIQCSPPNHNENDNNRQHGTIRKVSRISPLVQRSLRVVPEWVRNYVQWHKEQRLNYLNDPNTKFLTVTCHKDFSCGGLSDRLRPLPYFILAANKTGRGKIFLHFFKFHINSILF